MSVLVKVSTVAIVYICCAIFIRQYRPEYVFLLRFSSIIVIFLLVISELETFVNDVNEVLEMINVSSSHLKLMIKVGFISLLTDFITDTLKESGDNSLSGVVSVVSKIIIISLSLPILKGLLIVCGDLIK